MSQRIWITGASKGIGRAIARRYAQDGANVAVSARTALDLNSLAEESRDMTGSIHPFPMDVTNFEAVVKTHNVIQGKLGPLDLVIFNAGTHEAVDVTNFDVETFRRLIELNIMGAVHGLATVLPTFVKRGAGHIAVVSSVAGYRGLPTASAYGATKAALINLCEALYPELERHGVKLSLVNPGFVRTPLTDRNPFPMPFLMDVEKAADRLVQGLTRNRFEITFPRRFTWWVRLGRCLPYPIYFALTRRLIKE